MSVSTAQRRFEDFVERVGASAPAVSRALKQLEAAGVVQRVPYREPGRRARDEYHLTPAGEDLLPVFLVADPVGRRASTGRQPAAVIPRSPTGGGCR